MIRSACIVVALGLAAAGSTALAAPAKPEPVMMTDAQLDNVTAGDLIIVFQDSLNNLTINVGGSAGGNGLAKGWENGKGNPHKSDSGSSAVSSTKHGQTVLVTVNIITNVNTADATTGQTVGMQTVALTVPKK
jgi:hypothetical protein